MKIVRITLCLILGFLFLSVAAPRRTPSAPSRSDGENTRHTLAIDLLRSMNTAELDYKIKHEVYADWNTLFVNGDFTDKGTTWARRNGPLANVQFSKGSEIMPGWQLRLYLTADAKAYDLVLEDLTDDKCGYAASTDERGVIRQGKAIDCPLN